MLQLSQASGRPAARRRRPQQGAALVEQDLRGLDPKRASSFRPGRLERGDPTCCGLVVENLLNNAWKYTRKTSTPASNSPRRARRRARLFVKDDGVGFAWPRLEAFKPFQRCTRAASSRDGDGLRPSRESSRGTAPYLGEAESAGRGSTSSSERPGRGIEAVHLKFQYPSAAP